VAFSIKTMEGSNKAHIEYWSKLEKVSSIIYVCAAFAGAGHRNRLENRSDKLVTEFAYIFGRFAVAAA